MSITDDIRVRQVERLQENLATLRKLAGWTAEELGDKIGVTKQTISNWENYKPNDSSLKKINSMYGGHEYVDIDVKGTLTYTSGEGQEYNDLFSEDINLVIVSHN